MRGLSSFGCGEGGLAWDRQGPPPLSPGLAKLRPCNGYPAASPLLFRKDSTERFPFSSRIHWVRRSDNRYMDGVSLILEAVAVAWGLVLCRVTGEGSALPGTRQGLRPNGQLCAR